MTPLFSDTEYALALAAEMLAGEGTRFIPWHSDCVVWPLKTAFSVLDLPPVVLPRYPIRGISTVWRDLVVDYIESIPGMMLVEDEDPDRIIGDILFFSLGNHWHHLGLVYQTSVFFHSLPRYGVHRSDIRNDMWARRLWRTYRLMEVAE